MSENEVPQNRKTYKINPDSMFAISPEEGGTFILQEIRVDGSNSKKPFCVEMEAGGLVSTIVSFDRTVEKVPFNMPINVKFCLYNKSKVKAILVSGLMLPPDDVEYNSNSGDEKPSEEDEEDEED